MGVLKIELFGDFRIFVDDVAIELPPSKKARALLAYLIVSERPQRREHLCELLWDTPHDPKGSLRWALSKLKQTFTDDQKFRVEADRERISFNVDNLDIDTSRIETLMLSETKSKVPFLLAKQQTEHQFLAGLDIPNLDQFSLWLADQRERAEKFRGRLIERCLQCEDLFQDEEIQLARDWLDCQPYNPTAAKTLIALLKRGDAATEAQQLTNELTARFNAVGHDFHSNQKATPREVDQAQRDRKLLNRQKIQFCKTSTGVNLAFASVGSGPPLVKAANWLTHLELDWSAPIWSPLYRELAQEFTFIRYDERGNGLSDWDVDELSQETFVKDLECVVDNLGLEKFPLLGISQGAAVSIEYAIRNPERVSKLILFGGYPKGWRVDSTPEIIQQREAMITLTKTGWGQNNPAYRHVFSSTFMPSASPQDLAWFDEFQRQTTSAENAVKFLQAFADIDVRHQLSKISVPTLVIHSRGDQRIDWQVGRDIAAEIPNAEFVTLDSDNHLLLEGEPAAEQFISAVRDFLLT